MGQKKKRSSVGADRRRDGADLGGGGEREVLSAAKADVEGVGAPQATVAAGGAVLEASPVAVWKTFFLGQVPRIAVMVGLATAMGIAFNASSPVGIGWRRLDRSIGEGSVRGSTNSVVAGIEGTKTSDVAASSSTSGPTLGSTLGATALEGGWQSLTNLAPMEWKEAKALQASGRAVLVDARAKAYFDLDTIPGAVSMSVFGKPEDFEAFAKKYPTNTVLVTFCGSSSCPLSHHLAERLAREYGYGRVFPMTTGYLEWKRDEGGGFEPRKEAFPTTWSEVASQAKTGGVVLVDIRSAAEYAAGHLPGALSLPETATKEQWAAFGKQVPKDRSLVVYGSRSGMVQPLQMGTRLIGEGGYRSVHYLREGFVEWQQLERASKAGGAK